MNKIPDTFCGYIKVGNDEFAYNVMEHKVTLLPTGDNSSHRYDVIRRVRNFYTGQPQYIFGESNGYGVAMLLCSDLKYNPLKLTPAARFSTPVIVKAMGNTQDFYERLSDKWDKFHAITFWGGSINALYSPAMAVNLQEFNPISSDGSRNIKIYDWDKYTKRTAIRIDDEDVWLTLSIYQSGEHSDKERMGLYSLGELNSYIRFSFNTSQPFIKIVRLYSIVKSLVAILTRQSSVKFDVYLSQRDADGNFPKTAMCKIFDSCANYSSAQAHHVFPISQIFDCIPKLVDAISSNNTDSILQVLPNGGARIKTISITDVQNLCTALEVAYSYEERQQEKDELIKSLKSCIKKTIRDFSSQNGIDVNRETTIASCFKYLDFTLNIKILTLYQENKDIIDSVAKKNGLPELTAEKIDAFVKLRNNKTHGGKFEWGDSADIYWLLFCLLYVCLLKHIELAPEHINSLIYRLF